MKKQTLILLIILAFLTSGCNLPGYQDTEQPDDSMATEIAKILTGTPIEIELSPTTEKIKTETEAPPEEDVVITHTRSGPDETILETATPEPTDAPTFTPTATLADADPVKNLGDADWVDSMDDGDNWPTGYNEYTSIAFKDGYLQLTAEKDVDGWRLSWPYLQNFYLEAKLQSTDCAGADRFGLMFRVPSHASANMGYLIGITCDGQYALRRWNSETMAYLVNWTANDVINIGENAVNRIGVWAEGSTLTLYVNGQKITEVTDNTFLEGSFGIFVGKGPSKDLTIWVDQIRYWILP